MAANIPAGPPPITMPSIILFFIDLVLFPDLLQSAEGLGQLLLPAGRQGHHQSVHHTQRCHQRIHQGGHVALGLQDEITGLAQGGGPGIGHGDDLGPLGMAEGCSGDGGNIL